LFAWFESTQSKSRVNFLELLRAGRTDDVLNAGALEYMARHKLPQKTLHLLEEGETHPDRDRRGADGQPAGTGFSDDNGSCQR
jgi:hypothetical protein